MLPPDGWQLEAEMYSPATNKKPVRRTHCDVNSREVLVLYRMRVSTEGCGENGAVARVRYSDLKEAARVAADAGVMHLAAR